MQMVSYHPPDDLPSEALHPKIIASVICEIAAVMKATEDSLKTIRMGFGGKVLKRVVLVQKDASGEIQAMGMMEIDWTRHELHLQAGEESSSFPIDVGRSVAEQVSAAFKPFLEYVAEIQDRLGIVKVEPKYWYTDEVYASEEKQQAAQKLLGLSPLNKTESAKLTEALTRFAVIAGLSPGNLDELAMSYSHNSLPADQTSE